MGASDLQVLLPLLACLLSAGSALSIYLRDPGERTNQVATLLIAGAAWWGVCQTLWTVAPTAERAYFWHHAAGPGWAFIGPLALHLISLHANPPRWLRTALPPTYAVAACFALLQLFTPLLHRNAFPTPIGWGFEPTAGHAVYLAFTFACAIPAAAIALGRVRQSASPAERRQVRVIALGIGAPFLLAGLTGGLLPFFGFQLPRLGPISFGLLGVTVAWSYYRYGFSALAPSAFSREILATLPDGLALVNLDGRAMLGNERIAELLAIDPADLSSYPIGEAFSEKVLDPERPLREHECRLRRADGAELVVSVSTSLLLDKAGVPIGIVLVVRDQRELVALRSRLMTSGRLAAVGELAAGIAHEINNPIAFVRSNLSQLQQDWQVLAKRLPVGAEVGDDGLDLVREGEELLLECIEGVERTVRIVHDVRGFAHAGSGSHELVDLDDVIARVLRVLRPQVRSGVRVEFSPGRVPAVLGTAPQLQQVFLNLVLNAVQAIEGEGRVLVETRLEHDAVTATVSDDGTGISPEARERIFDPFFTTKPVGVGTGLGLAISYQILERHDAELSVESEPGTGSAFCARFPLPANAG